MKILLTFLMGFFCLSNIKFEFKVFINNKRKTMVGYDNKLNLSSNKFEQRSGDTINLSGCTNIISATGKINSNTGYRVSGTTIFMARGVVIPNSIEIGYNANSSGNASTAIGFGAQSIGNSSISIGCGNIVCSTDSNLIGGKNSIICSGNTNSTFIGFNTCTIPVDLYQNTVIVPNLTILNTPSGTGGNYLGWDATTKKICFGCNLISSKFQMTSGATDGYILTSDASGNASWEAPSASGLIWTGNTVNGIGTYNSSGTICSEPNLIFNGTSLCVTGNVCATTNIISLLVSGTTVCGTNIKSTNFQMTSGATDGYILTSDASGNASWKESSGSTSGGHTIQDGGVSKIARTNLDFLNGSVADNAGNDSTEVDLEFGAEDNVDNTNQGEGTAKVFDTVTSTYVDQEQEEFDDSIILIESNLDSTVDQLNIYIPAGYKIVSCFLNETSSNATTNFDIGTTSGGVDIYSGAVIAADFDGEITLLLDYFSRTADQDIYVTIAGSAIIDINFKLEKIW